MRSLAPVRNQDEADFDDLLGQLADELAMKAPTESMVAQAPLATPAARVESTTAMAAEAAEAARLRAPAPNHSVKIAAIIASAFTVVGLAAVFMFAGRDADDSSAPDEQAEVEAPAPAPETPPAPVPEPIVVPPTPPPVEPVVVAPVPEPEAAKPERPRKPKPKPKPKPEPEDDGFDKL